MLTQKATVTATSATADEMCRELADAEASSVAAEILRFYSSSRASLVHSNREANAEAADAESKAQLQGPATGAATERDKLQPLP